MSYQPCILSRAVNVTQIFTIFDTVHKSGFNFAGEYHDFWEIQCVIDGNAGIAAGQQIYKLERAHLVLHRPMEFHSVWNEGETGLHLGVISFSANITAPINSSVFTLTDELLDTFVSIITDAHTLFEFYPENSIYVKKVKNGDILAVQHFLSRFELFLSSVLALENSAAVKSDSISAKNYILICDTIASHLGSRLSVPEIADMCRMSVSNVKKIFRKYAGCGLIEYYNSMKMIYAKQLLDSGRSVGETADLLGYENQNYFSSAFKKITGLSPSQYKSGSR